MLQQPPPSPLATPHINLVRAAAEAYAQSSRSSLVRLQEVWQDIELPQAQQVAVLEDIISRAHLVWEEAVAAAEAKQQRLRGEVEEALREIAGIKEELGDDVMRRGAQAELDQLKGEERVHKTLCAWRGEVLQKAAYWRNCRLQRLGEYDELQALLRQARAQIGRAQPAAPERPNISRATIEYLRLELDKLRAEKERREERLGVMTQQLRGVCSEVGEEAELALAEVHGSLALLGDSTARQVLRDVYKLAGSAAAPPGSSSQVDLSDETMARLHQKLDALGNLKAQRSAHASELMAILHSLWDACGVSPDAHERAALSRLMGGPLRLHTRSLEKCMAEVRRCEEAKVAQMLEIVNAKARELIDLCAETHIAPPGGLGPCIAALNAPQGRSPGAAADLLTKLVRMLSEVQVVAAKRSAIISGINEVEEARREEAWLCAFEADEARYKGRDANKKLQRAIKAQKMRERLPAMSGAVRRGLAEWRETEGAPFLYDGRDYDALLEELEQRLDFLAQEKVAKSAARRQAGPAPAPASAAPSPTPTGRLGSAASAPAQGAPRTPLPKGISTRQLQERHSIAIVGGGATGREQAQVMRSSGQLAVKATPSRAGARTPPPGARTPPPSATRTPAAAPGATPRGPAASARLADIFNRSPLQQSVPTLEAATVAAEAAAAATTSDGGAAAHGVRTPTPDVPGGGHARGGGCGSQEGGGPGARGEDQGIGDMYRRLVAQTGGSKQAAAASPPSARGGDQGAHAAAAGTPPSAGRGGSRIPQPQF
ncbi:hypothetical protein MNEG_0212 [Monoraphidium neglectum]|uniref:Protein regulator of cytokinesis 1 n=1 Tax=Monoraphidium neglectum TaxID=145388 RepID=A0A0D2KCF4_9CHLO|nr:hypothetical protein MNEG_0212 [Monoraphidium neglectum]KIZ07743.1 hypothetical protein MNEG_0212 [Monoraphidium neglectum]|eukprot:XP_013906762.1 hypothetical protein MNEG_0212 [Monoraphidium neglectum]